MTFATRNRIEFLLVKAAIGLVLFLIVATATLVVTDQPLSFFSYLNFFMKAVQVVCYSLLALMFLFEVILPTLADVYVGISKFLQNRKAKVIE